tara:strand:+ start:229 stop:426 length:198 start_codon:yes stop_codon:yes gene_type:complete
MGEPYTIMKYKIKAIIKDVQMTPNGPMIEQEILSVRRDFMDEYRQTIFERASQTQTISKKTTEDK